MQATHHARQQSGTFLVVLPGSGRRAGVTWGPAVARGREWGGDETTPGRWSAIYHLRSAANGDLHSCWEILECDPGDVARLLEEEPGLAAWAWFPRDACVIGIHPVRSVGVDAEADLQQLALSWADRFNFAPPAPVLDS